MFLCFFRVYVFSLSATINENEMQSESLHVVLRRRDVSDTHIHVCVCLMQLTVQALVSVATLFQ